MTQSCRILAAGELLVEFIASVENTGHRKVVPYLGPYPSGAPGIFIDQVACLGGEASMVGAVGNDAFGDAIIARLEADGVDCALVGKRIGQTTGTAFVVYDDAGGREFIYHLHESAAASFGMTRELEASFRKSPPTYIHISGSTLGHEKTAGAVLQIARAAVTAGTAVSFDPNVRPELLASRASRERIDELLGMTTILFPSNEDLATLSPGKTIDDVLSRYLASGMEAVVLTSGDGGCVYRDRETNIQLAAFPVSSVDPTGAGDCFSGTFLTLYGQGWPPAEALRYANAAGALAVTESGPMEGNSTIEDISAFLETA